MVQLMEIYESETSKRYHFRNNSRKRQVFLRIGTGTIFIMSSILILLFLPVNTIISFLLLFIIAIGGALLVSYGFILHHVEIKDQDNEFFLGYYGIPRTHSLSDIEKITYEDGRLIIMLKRRTIKASISLENDDIDKMNEIITTRKGNGKLNCGSLNT